MVFFSCVAYAANRATSIVLPGRTDIVSAAGAFAIGSLGNIYSRVVRGTAFTSMITGVLFLVPVCIKSIFVQYITLTQSVWHCARRRREPGLSDISRTIFQRLCPGPANDLCGRWRHCWLVR